MLKLGAITLLDRIASDLLVVALESRKILTCLRELAFLHTLTDIPVDECTLRVHEIEFVRKGRPGFGDGSGVGKHAT